MRPTKSSGILIPITAAGHRFPAASQARAMAVMPAAQNVAQSVAQSVYELTPRFTEEEAELLLFVMQSVASHMNSLLPREIMASTISKLLTEQQVVKACRQCDEMNQAAYT